MMVATELPSLLKLQQRVASVFTSAQDSANSNPSNDRTRLLKSTVKKVIWEVLKDFDFSYQLSALDRIKIAISKEYETFNKKKAKTTLVLDDQVRSCATNIEHLTIKITRRLESEIELRYDAYLDEQ
jgi:hypothetical protein